MKRTRITVALALTVSAALAGSHVSAITNGQPDGNGHPNVGVMVAEWRTPGVKDAFCTGTLVARRVFLTAAHCDVSALGIPADQVWVSFDPVYTPTVSPLYHGTFVVSPEYTNYRGQGGQADPHDIAVIQLDEEPTVTPATLPRAGFLSSQKLRNQRFTAIGYGSTRVDKTRGQQNIEDQSARYVAMQGFLSLEPAWLNLSMNPSTGSGGGCYGDSGGPHFLGDVLVSLTITGDIPCRATDKTYRLDTASARRFLASQGVPLP